VAELGGAAAEILQYFKENFINDMPTMDGELPFVMAFIVVYKGFED